MAHKLVSMLPGSNPHVVDSPIKFEKPIYGSREASFTDFVAPGIMTTITFGQSLGLTALAFVMDVKEGLLDRCWATGVRSSEVMLAHVVTQFIVAALQILVLLIFALAVCCLSGQSGN